MSHVGMFYVCGDCSQRFNTESEVRDHIAIQDADGATHDGTSWSVCDDEVCIVARRAISDSEYGESTVPWSFFGSWRFSDTDFASDESIGWEVRQLLRMGYVDIRVVQRTIAEEMVARSRVLCGGDE